MCHLSTGAHNPLHNNKQGIIVTAVDWGSGGGGEGGLAL